MIQPSRPILVAILLLQAFAASALDTSALPARIDQALRARGIPQSAVSISVKDATSGEVYLALNAEEPRRPASTMKVLTGLAALETLGPSYHWHTRAYAVGSISDGQLRGNLWIQGGGDPYLTLERWWLFTRGLRLTGLRAVEGDFVIDNSLYALANTDADEFDGQGTRTYNVIPEALLVNFGNFDVRVSPRETPRITVDPHPVNLSIGDELELVDGACRNERDPVMLATDAGDPHRVTVRGRLASRCEALVVHRTLLPAADYAFGTWVDLWQGFGGEIHGGLQLARTPANARLLYDFESLPLDEQLRSLMKYSNNPMARMFLLTLGIERFGAPASEASGRRAVLDWLAAHGLDCPELVIDNGSGLSRISRISASSMSRILGVAYRSRYFPEFANALPIGGQEGTLSHRFRDEADSARIRLKTGHINDVAAVAGWVTARSGRAFTVVVFVNAPGAHQAAGDAVIDSVVHWTLDR